MFERSSVSGQTEDLSGHLCPVNGSPADASEPHLSAIDRTDVTGVTGHPCPPNPFSESLSEKHKQAAAGESAERAYNTFGGIPPNTPAHPHATNDAIQASSPRPCTQREGEAIDGFSALKSLASRNRVRFHESEIRELVEAGSRLGLASDGVVAFAADKIRQKRDERDPVYSAKLLIRAMNDKADFSHWIAKVHRVSSFFQREPSDTERLAPDKIGTFIAELSQRLRALPGYDEIAVQLDCLVARADEGTNELEVIEECLTELEGSMVKLARARLSTSEEQEIRLEVSSQLEFYRSKMSKEQLRTLEDQDFASRTLERAGLPRLSLFYLADVSKPAA